MIGKFIAKGVPKCSNCIFHRINKENNVMTCIKFLGSHDKPIEAEIARYNDLMCGYHGTQHQSGELVSIEQVKDVFVSNHVIFQPHI